MLTENRAHFLHRPTFSENYLGRDILYRTQTTQDTHEKELHFIKSWKVHKKTKPIHEWPAKINLNILRCGDTGSHQTYEGCRPVLPECEGLELLHTAFLFVLQLI